MERSIPGDWHHYKPKAVRRFRIARVSHTGGRGAGGCLRRDHRVISGGAGVPSHASLRNVVLERNSLYGVVIENGVVAIGDSTATSNDGVGFYALAFSAGETARVFIDSSQATHNGSGFNAGGGSGTAELFISGSVASTNGKGVRADTNGTVRVAHTTVTGNSIGFEQIGGVFESRGDNNLRGNTTNKSGTITTYAPE